MLTISVKDNMKEIQKLLDSPTDLITRLFNLGKQERLCGILCIDGLVDKNLINEQILNSGWIAIQLNSSHYNHDSL